ncbi:grasp-with-spasm system ATP-grasp peptide maturase [Runella salmonicolor]|uniref:Grasp-with-spasm system ATP-grasp peptide maturase n=1 Tax=Runella salmonicolor TaxID=2950278 RepID=A0ABT1FMV9_9BACT|nr:grasp-with-spasm system ATP-grasp peptide maturase [Runella salmonicolor]MCP1383084.1 grasp-with-spasm system ATP-grasp peptide maturase [Runella salmonicolor]
MIIILTHHSDQTVNEVISWLYVKGASFYRINIEDFLNKETTFTLLRNGKKKIYLSEKNSSYGIKLLKNNKEAVFWFRKWSRPAVLNEHYKTDSLEYQIGQFVEDQIEDYQKIFFSSFKKSKWLNSINVINLKKLDLLSKAAGVGLNTPRTIVTTSKSELIKFKKKAEKIITKTIGDTQFFYNKKKTYGLYTSLINESDIENIPDFFVPTLFQEYIEKKYEIRVFMLEEKFYSMAIFSQNSDKTKIDFREYDEEIPNRNVPYLLPSYIEKLLLIFSKKIGLNSGSFDLIKTIHGNYVFLEVNPVGQFGMVSYPCNYFLEEKIANYLLKLTANNG